jgi:hypothetical protein
MAAELSQQQQQHGEEQPFPLLELPRAALVAVLTALRHTDKYCNNGLRNISCSCKQLNLLVSLA